MYLLIYNIDGFIEEKRGNKYDEELKKYKEVMSGIKSCIQKINNNKYGEYDDMKRLYETLKLMINYL